MSYRLLLGRSRELADLEAAFERALAGHGGAFLVSGEPGIGKTRLAEEIAERAERRGAAVVWGRAWEVAGAPTFGPWQQVLRALAPGATDLLAPSGTGDPDAELARQSSVVVEILRPIAAERPLVLVFDDLHAADVPSLALLQRVAHELGTLRVFVVGTYREVEARRAAPVAALLARTARAGTVRPLGRLDETSVGEWLAAVLGVAPAPALAAAVFAATEGNPLFVEAVAQLLAARGQSPELEPGFTLPDGIREAVNELVARVPPDASLVLEAAAVLGRECSGAALALVAGVPAAAMLQAIEAAVAAGVLAAPPRPSSPVRFAHVLVREAIYQALPATRRIELHARAAEALARLHAAEPEGHLAELAHHAFESAPLAGWLEAADLAARAGRHALERAAFDDAAAHFGRALLARDRAERDDDAGRAELLIGLGTAQIRIGQARLGRDSCERAAALAERSGQADLFASAALAFGVEVVGGQAAARLVELLEAAHRIEPGSEPLRARVMARLAAALVPSPAPERPVALARDAIALARTLDDPRVLAQVLATARAAFTPAQDFGELRALDLELVDLAGALGDRLLAIQAQGRLALLAIGEGDAAEARLRLDIQADLADGVRVPQHQLRAASLRLLWANITDDEPAIAESERRIRELALRLDDSRGLLVLEANRYTRAELSGDFAAASAAVDRLEREIAGDPLWGQWWRPVWRAVVLAETGRLDDARAVLAATPIQRLCARGAGSGPGLLCRMARIAILFEDEAWMRDIKDQLLRFEWQIAVNTAAPMCEGPVAYHLGRLAGALGHDDRAERYFRDALARAESAGLPGYAAQARRALAALGRPAATATPTVQPAPETPPRLQRDGELWTLSHDGREVRLKDSKGLGYLAALLGEPGREFHVGDLVGIVANETSVACVSDADARDAGLSVGRLGDSGEILDARARAAYRKRLDDLRDALEDAEERGDRDGMARLRAEREILADELARAVGLAGRARKAGSASERARINVQRRIRDVLTRISEVDAPLARYLDRRVKTGSFCSFEA